MSVAIINPKFYAWAPATGEPLAFGKVYTYQPGTSTPKATYQSEDGETENANPVILNAAGYAEIYLNGSYKIVVTDADDVEQWTADPVSNPSEAQEQWVNEREATQISATSFSIVGNYTDIYKAGTAIKLDDSTIIYGHIESSQYVSGNTEVEIVSDDAITANLSRAWVSIITKNGVPKSIADGVNSGVIRAGSISELKAIDASVDWQISLDSDGRSGVFVVASGSSPVTDTKEGIYINLDNGNHAVRQEGKPTVTGAKLKPEWFGLIKDDDTASVAEENHSVLRECIAFSFKHHIPDGVNQYAPLQIELPSGKIFVKGSSPFAFNRTEQEAFGGSRFLRGLSWQGKGRKSTRIILMNDGSETWLYDTTDLSNSDTSVQDYVTFSDLTLESYDYFQNDRKYPVATASKINGFLFETYGWEKFFNFNSVTFEGFDVLFRLRGNGNGDQNSFFGCRMFGIIDVVFDVNNNQSVTNRIYGTDCFTYGDVFRIGEDGGGDFLWSGGSVVQYPVYASGDNLPDNTASASSLRAFLKVDLGTVSTGIALADGNGKFVFEKLRFENYDDFQHLVYSVRDNLVQYGRVDATFKECQMLVEKDKDDSGNNSAKAGRRNLVLIDKQETFVKIINCPISKNHDFRVKDVGGPWATRGTATVLLEDCRLAWDTTVDGPLKDRFIAEVDTSDRSNAVFKAVGCTSNVARAGTKSCEDVSISAASNSLNTDSLTYAQIKDKNDDWPNNATSSNRLYLPPGAVVTTVFIDKKEVTGAAGNSNYFFRLADSSNSVRHSFPEHQEDGAQLLKVDITTPFRIPASPDNWIQLWGNNGSGVDKGNSECFLVGYFTGEQ